MAIDQPLIVYDHKKGKKGKGEKREFTAPSKEAMHKAKEQYEKMKAEREKKKALEQSDVVNNEN